jgi:ABC-type oligopeptide transport system ATPase subunit
MLDVSVQAQILTLLKELRQNLNFALLLISHDLDVIRIMCDRVLIMLEGRIIESGATEDVFTHPQEPYTRSLLQN